MIGKSTRVSLFRIKQVQGFWLIGFLFLASCGSNNIRVLSPETKIPQMPGYLRGVLKNGLRYSIRANDRIADRMNLYLAVSAGSLQEEEDQQGLAHFVEHMAFNGSEHFPGNALIEFARENGMRFGAHVNAYTSFEETVYNFALPSHDELLQDKGLTVLYDWLSGLSIEPEEVEKERGVVLNEWRGSLGFAERFRNIWLPFILEGSKYQERLPIGTAHIIETVDPQRLRDFYEKWYSTKNAMIVAVGDFDAEQMRERIEKIFSPIAPRGQILSSGMEREWEEVPIRLASGGKPDVRAIQIQDDEAPVREMGISIKVPRLPFSDTVGELHEQVLLELLRTISAQRISDLLKRQSSTLEAMGGFGVRNYGTASLYQFFVQGQKGQLKKAYNAMLEFIAQIKKYGVLQSEMDLAIEVFRSNIEVAYTEREKLYNEDWAIQELNQFLGEEYNGDIVWLYENFSGIVAGLNLQQINDKIIEVLQGSDVAIMAIGTNLAELPSEEEMVSGYRGLDQLEVEPLQEKKLAKRLLQSRPEPGAIRSEENLPKTGYVHWTLSNGLDVYFKQTEFKQNQLQFSAFRRSGLDTLGDGFGPASIVLHLMNNVVSPSGLGGLSPEAYERYMAPLKLGQSWGFDLDGVKLSGNSDLSDIAELFQQIYLAFTAPQFSQKLIDQGLKDLETSYDDILADPEGLFFLKLRQDRFQNDLRIVWPEPEFFGSYTAADLQQAFEKMIPNAAGFTFVFVGNIEEKELKKYLEEYLAPLPSDKKFQLTEGRFNFYPKGGKKTFALGPKNKAVSFLLWDEYILPENFSDGQNYRTIKLARMLNSLLEIRVNKILREEMGKTYSPSVRMAFDAMPANRMTTTFYYSSAPEDVEALDKAASKIIAEIQAGNIDDGEFEDIKEQEKNSFHGLRQENNFWVHALQSAIWLEYEDIDTMLSEENFYQVLESITKQELQDFAVKYIRPARKMAYVMLPKNN